MSETGGIQSVARTFSVIEAMACETQSSVSDLARRTGLNKTTVFRILDTLVNLGYAARNNETEKYNLTLKFLKISTGQLNNYDIHKVMHPLLERLMQTTGETVHLVEHQGENVVYIDKCESNINSVRMVSRIGLTLEVFTTAVGKAILAYLSDGEITDLWGKCSHVKKTPNTITKLDKYLEEIRTVRLQGFAVDNEENELDVRCVAVAVPDALGNYKYAVSISAPKSRTADAVLIQRAQLLKKVISEEL